jgi:hypothetical protein
LIAATSRTSIFLVRLLPSLSNSRSCKAPQKFGLDLDWNVSNLVEKQCPLIGELKPADLLRNRASEGASFMPKELTLEQPTRNRGAVEFYKSPPFPPAACMDGARKQFLSRTGFAEATQSSR